MSLIASDNQFLPRILRIELRRKHVPVTVVIRDVVSRDRHSGPQQLVVSSRYLREWKPKARKTERSKGEEKQT